jgi:hypothetical protein
MSFSTGLKETPAASGPVKVKVYKIFNSKLSKTSIKNIFTE